MKYLIVLWGLSLFLFASSIECVVSKNVVQKIKPLFKEQIRYSKCKVRLTYVPSEMEVLRVLTHQKRAKFAIVRRDVLWQLQQNKNDLMHSYILISELPFFATLYLVQDKEAYDIDLLSLKQKKVSIGHLGGYGNVYLKALLKKSHIKNSVLYKSLPYETSIKAIKDGKLDAYFGFLLPSKESSDLHFQTLFSEQTETYFKKTERFNVDYNGISSPYVLVASTKANDEEIESIIYRLMEKELFVPITYDGFGAINRYVLNHVQEVEKALKKRYVQTNHESKKEQFFSKRCRQYHYGFLRLLRQKPALKKKLKRIYSEEESKEMLQNLNDILLEIEAKKERCNLAFLKKQKRKFKTLFN